MKRKSLILFVSFVFFGLKLLQPFHPNPVFEKIILLWAFVALWVWGANWMIVAGASCNMVVMASNGWLMPHTSWLNIHGDVRHVLASSSTHLVFLSDCIPFGSFSHGAGSIGDLLLLGGLLFTISGVIIRKRITKSA